MWTGSCLCGQIRYELTQEMDEVVFVTAGCAARPLVLHF